MQIGFSRTLQELTMKIGELEILRGFVLKLRGNGKKYQFRCRMGNDFDEDSYSHYFVTKNVRLAGSPFPFQRFCSNLPWWDS